MTAGPTRGPITTPTARPKAGSGPELADLVAAAARSVPGVAGLHPGPHGEVAAYLPGRRVPGIRLRADRVEVHVVLEWGTPVLAVADAVRVVVAELAGLPVDVTIEDVVPADAVPGEDRPAGSFELPR